MSSKLLSDLPDRQSPTATANARISDTLAVVAGTEKRIVAVQEWLGFAPDLPASVCAVRHKSHLLTAASP